MARRWEHHGKREDAGSDMPSSLSMDEPCDQIAFEQCAARGMSRDLRRVPLEMRDARLLCAFVTDKWEISDELVFPSAAGAPIEMNNFYARVFKPLLAAAGLRKIRFHDLRHTFASLLIQAGAPLACVRDQMGRRSIQVTVDIYGHLVPDAHVGFVDRLDRLCSPRQSATKTREQFREFPASPSE
jgi:integrase